MAMSAFQSSDQGTELWRVQRALSATPSIRAALFLVALLLFTLVPAPQAEADSHPTGTVGRANLDGTGIDQSFITGLVSPSGVAVDDAHIYWTNRTAGTMGRARLDGTGVDQGFISGLTFPAGVAVDDSHVYWAKNGSPGAIGRANLIGTGVDQSFISPLDENPGGVAVDDAHIYWAGAVDGPWSEPAVGRANLDGSGVDQGFISGGDDVDTSVSSVAVDDTHVYWGTNTWDVYSCSGNIGRANLDGGGADQSFIGTNGTSGVAVDDSHVFWADPGIWCGHGGEEAPHDPTIGRANLDGSDADRRFISGFFIRDFFAPGPPTDVAVDDSRLYWTARSPSNEFSFGKVRRNKKRGTARLTVRVPGSGDLELARTKRVMQAARRVQGAEKVKLPVRARGKARKRLNRRGRAKVKAKVTYTPKGGEFKTGSRRIKLRKRV
jgi:virginiamycin B lyase